MYTLSPTDIDNGGEFFRKLNENFAESANPQSSHTDEECRTRFISEMNRKAGLLGMTGTTFYDPAGNQPVTVYRPNYQTDGYPQAFYSSEANVMTAIDALRMMVYASGFKGINDAWNIRQFTLTYRNGTAIKTATVKSSVYNNSTLQTSLDALMASYDILGGKTGSMMFEPLWANTLINIVRSKATGKVYAVVDFSTTTARTVSDNKWIDTKKILDNVDAGGAAPSFSQGGACVIELPTINPALLNRASISTLFEYNKTGTLYPASITKIMTGILLCENVPNLEQTVTVHESDRQPPTGTNFEAGDVLRLRELLECLMTESSNTSAQVIARVVGGILLDKDANVLT